jgi:hypothetical protein
VDDFNRLRDGADIDEVRRALGSDGTHDTHSTVGDLTADTWTWRYDDGSFVIVMFTNGRLSSKSQRGLR